MEGVLLVEPFALGLAQAAADDFVLVRMGLAGEMSEEATAPEALEPGRELSAEPEAGRPGQDLALEPPQGWTMGQL